MELCPWKSKSYFVEISPCLMVLSTHKVPLIPNHDTNSPPLVMYAIWHSVYSMMIPLQIMLLGKVCQFCERSGRIYVLRLCLWCPVSYHLDFVYINEMQRYNPCNRFIRLSHDTSDGSWNDDIICRMAALLTLKH